MRGASPASPHPVAMWRLPAFAAGFMTMDCTAPDGSGASGAWYPAAWAAGSAWNAANWYTLSNWFGYSGVSPYYYNYGTNVTYNNGNVYDGSQLAATAPEYYQQAVSLADAGSATPLSTDGEWLPLGVFALSRQGESSSNLIMQLAVNKQGIIGGNYTDTVNNDTLPIHGSVDKQTQRAAWTVGNNKGTVLETGLYNLTKEEAPVLLHINGETTQQWLLVRLHQPPQNGQPAGSPAPATAQQ